MVVGVHIRRARRADAAAIAGLAAELARALGGDPALRRVAHVLRNGFGHGRTGEYHVALRDGAVVGYALLGCNHEAHSGNRVLLLSDLCVDPAVRRGGVGRALMARVARRAAELDCTSVIWEVWNENPRAFPFYEVLGAWRSDDVTLMRLTGDALAGLAGE